MMKASTNSFVVARFDLAKLGENPDDGTRLILYGDT